MKKRRLTKIGKVTLAIVVILLLENLRYVYFIHQSKKSYELVINDKVIKPNEVLNGNKYLFAKDSNKYIDVEVPINSTINLPKSYKLENSLGEEISGPINYLSDDKYKLEVKEDGYTYKYLLEVDNDFSVEVDETFSYPAGYLHVVFRDVNKGEKISVSSDFKTSPNLIISNDMYVPIDYDNKIGEHKINFKSDLSSVSKSVNINYYEFNEVHFDVEEAVIEDASKEVDSKVEEAIFNADNINTKSSLHTSIYSHPSVGYRSSEFGDVRYINGATTPTKYHFGLDYAAATNTPVYSTTEGKVVFTGSTPRYGNLVIIDHGLGVTSHYYHLEYINVKTGDTVNSTTQIGGVGTTGYSTGPHLHFEIHLNGTIINPNFMMDSYGI